MRRGILADAAELSSLGDRIARKPFDRIYETLRKRCSSILESPPVTEAHWRATWEQGVWASATLAARTTQGRIFDLVIAHHIERNTAYRDRAIEELKDLCAWSTWVDPCHNRHAVDLCTAECAVTAAVGLDWLWDDLHEADRFRVLQAIRHKAIEPYRRSIKEGAWWYTCYHSWNAVVNSGCGLAGLALSGEEPAAQEAYHLARQGLTHFFDALGREGGWDEGTGYWGYAMRYLLLLGEAAARLLDDMSLFHYRGMDATGLFPIYFSPHGQAASFGDAATVPLYSTYYLLVKHFGLKEVTWWLDTYAFGRDIGATDWSAGGLAMLFRPVDAEVTAQPDLAPVKAFNQIGWAAIADQWPRPSFYVAAKSGDLAANHSQRDMNSIQVQVDGEMLLVDLDHPPFSQEYFSDARASYYEVQARGHNTLTVGQRDHRIDAQGSIIEAQTGKDFRWLACDSNTACGENVHFVRHLVMIVNPGRQAGRTLLVLDEVQSPVPERIDVYWHTKGRIRLDGRTLTGEIAGSKAAVNFLLAATTKASGVVETPELYTKAKDQVLHLSAGPTGKAVLLSVFSREKLPAKVELKQVSGGDVRVKLGGIRLHFKSLRRHLQLATVEAP